MAPVRSAAVTTAPTTFSLSLFFKLVFRVSKSAKSSPLGTLGMTVTLLFLLVYNVLTIRSF